MSCTTCFKSATYLPCGVEFTAAEASGTLDAISRTIIVRGVSLEQWENSLGAVGSP
jgi:hypothetical protein